MTGKHGEEAGSSKLVSEFGWGCVRESCAIPIPSQQSSRGEGGVCVCVWQGWELEPEAPETGGNALTFSLRTGGHHCTQMCIITCGHVHIIF